MLREWYYGTSTCYINDVLNDSGTSIDKESVSIAKHRVHPRSVYTDCSWISFPLKVNPQLCGKSYPTFYLWRDYFINLRYMVLIRESIC